MASEVMMVCEGGRLVGPMAPEAVVAYAKSFGRRPHNVDFVITPTQGWMPFDMYMKWLKACAHDAHTGAGTTVTRRFSLRAGGVGRLVDFCRRRLFFIIAAVAAVAIGGVLLWRIIRFL